jgi:mannosyl-oligosaccharide alpha-1,2-mannosidase
MGQTDIVNQIVDYIPTVNLKQSPESSISLFETTIRYLGGLLSGYDLLKETKLLNPQPGWAQPFPGLVGTSVDIDTGLFQDDFVSWCGGDDSYYEYLIKMYIYSPSRFGSYRDSWIAAAESTMTHLISHPVPRPDLTFLSIYNNGTYQEISQHLAGFAGGNFLLAGSVLKRQDFIDFGLALTSAWHETYAEDATGIGPEEFSWDPTAVPAGQAAFFAKSGFYVTNGAYILRPEVIESYYYAYRITGNQTVSYSWPVVYQASSQ